MLLVQAYVYMGAKSPNEANIDCNTKQKLDVYLVLLKHIKQSSMRLSRIDTLNYKNNKNIPYPGEELIQSQNWYEIVKFWIGHHTKIRDDNLYVYIRRGD